MPKPIPPADGPAADVPAGEPSAWCPEVLRRRLEMATAAAGVAVWTHHLGDDEVHWDAQMWALHGAGAVLSAPGSERYLRCSVHPDDRAALSQGLRSLREQAVTLLEVDFRVLRSDGSMRRVASRTTLEDEGGNATLCGVMLDVTERHAAEAKLREAHERIALATRGAGIGTWEYFSDARVVWWDAQMFVLRGLLPGAASVPLEEAFASVHPDDRSLIERASAAPLAEGQTMNYEFRILRPDGQVRWLASRSTTLRDEPGQRPRRIGINWDVTEVHAAAAERQERLLAQRESLAKSQFLARTSHELRTPLNAVLGFARLLLSDADAVDHQQVRERARHILQSGEQLLALVDETLALSGLETGERPGAEREGDDGAGIGLAQMRAAVPHMDGTVQVHSQPGSGTCVEGRLASAAATLPRAGMAVLPPPAPAPCDSALRHDVLYIEDNPVNLLIVAELVGRRADLRFHAAADGISGVELARRVRPGLVLIDMQLPDIDGLEVLRRLRADAGTAGLRCVALSANAMPADIQTAMRAGFDAYRTKPLDFAAFTADLDAQFGPGSPMPPPTARAARRIASA